MEKVLDSLLHLAHEIGREDRKLACLGEGNLSAKISAEEFIVKASGCSLAALRPADLIVCRSEPVLSLLERKRLTDPETESTLLQSRRDAESGKPSTETAAHAWLLTLENVLFVGHCHPTAANQVLCSPRARDFAERRLFPDEVVYCGATSVFIPYTDPGVPLAREIRERTSLFIKNTGTVPRLILLQNHGIIALGPSPAAVLSCILMANKAAEIFVGAAALGGPNFLNAKDVERINARPDEPYRRNQLSVGSARG